MKRLNVAIIGHNFMGKAHSNAWRQASRFFDLPAEPVLKVACGRHAEPLKQFAGRWGWEAIETDWRRVVDRKDVDVIDIAVPTHLHREIAIAAAEAGKHLFCEKPMALDAREAAAMRDAAKRTGVVHYLNHNYRRCPAVAFARQLIDEGRVGTIYHWRGAYLQSWIVDPQFPLTWQLRKETAGAGPHYDLNSHSVDLARYLVGEIRSVAAMTRRFVDRRPLPAETGETAFHATTTSRQTGEVTVDDAAFMVAEFENGALGSFEASRFALGRKNFNVFEIYGSRGAIAFDLERMNELQLVSADDPESIRGFRTILATEASHPYMKAWWPPGHIIGYEHGFVHAVADFLRAVDSGSSIAPNFDDGVKIMQVLGAALESARTGQRILVG
jgi:predicted dehydrogenase